MSRNTNTSVQQATQKSVAERFVDRIVQEFVTSSDERLSLRLTEFQKRLIRNYFYEIDRMLKESEVKRKQDKNPLPYNWENIDWRSIALAVVPNARIGLDPALPNHIHFIPFKDEKTKKYKVGFIIGYRGLEIRSRKYGLDVPDEVIIELVYSNDDFKVIKKDKNNEIESYELNIKNPFNRGEIVGGFYYLVWKNEPYKNRIRVMTLKDILKRKPTYAAAEFWGGEKTIWENGKPAGTETVEGYFEEMCWKTLARAAYNSLTIDSTKIDDDYLRLKALEDQYAKLEAKAEIEENANTEIIEIIPEAQSEPLPAPEPEEIIPEEPQPANEKIEKPKEKPKEAQKKESINDEIPF